MDRHALPTLDPLDEPRLGRYCSSAPRTLVEEVAGGDLEGKVLGLEQVGVEDTFFLISAAIP